MTVLIAYASKHGATRGIAERIADKLTSSGKEVEARAVETIGDVTHYDAFVVGSAVYYGSWMKEATEFMRRNRTVLVEHPVWLFSCGPLGAEVIDSDEQPKDVAEFRQTIHPRDHRIFFGALVHSKLSFAERMVVKAVRASEGDFRNWDAIEAWAEEINRDLTPVSAKAELAPADFA